MIVAHQHEANCLERRWAEGLPRPPYVLSAFAYAAFSPRLDGLKAGSQDWDSLAFARPTDGETAKL
jgi:hypothetical protein